MQICNVHAAISQATTAWVPVSVGHFNGHTIMVVKAEGAYPWHAHADSDDCFLVLQGKLTIRMRDRHVHLGEGDMFVVPRAVAHSPEADGVCYFMLMEPDPVALAGNGAAAADIHPGAANSSQ